MFKEPSFIHLRSDHWKSKKKILLKLRESSIKYSSPDDNGIVTDYHRQLSEGICVYSQDLAEIFADELDALCNILDVSVAKITDSWFESSSKNVYHGVHNHGGDGYSAVCFLEYDDQEHGPTNFLSNSLSALDNEPMIYTPSDVMEGDILFFPSNLLHYTEPNTSDTNRLVVSWNMKFYKVK
tara:strand:- start:10212 stop:10757 length:546 start_codon:yes stop_codon:yes gene_type:complete